MTSTRLPGKVLLPIAGKPMLAYLIERLKQASSLDKIVVATSREDSDKPIVAYCQEKDIDIFCGNLEDVLGRFFHTALKYQANIIVRITADCPLIDGALVQKGITKFHQQQPIDYLSNTIKRTFPRGFDFEIFTFDALKKAHQQAKKEPEREHVTPYIWQNPTKFRLYHFKQEMDKSSYRITVDTQEDYQVVKLLIEKYSADKKNYQQITSILDAHPEIVKINSQVMQKKYDQ